MKNLTCFKAYDIRGELGEELNAEIAYDIGRVAGEFLQAKTIVVSEDVRLTSKALKAAVSQGLVDAGVDVFDIGLCGTEEIYRWILYCWFASECFLSTTARGDNYS